MERCRGNYICQQFIETSTTKKQLGAKKKKEQDHEL